MFDRMRGLPQVRQVPQENSPLAANPSASAESPPETAVQARSRPQQERSRRRYSAIVLAAAELFATTGFDGTTMEAIASAAETSIGSVYRFFPNKQAVFRAVAERALERVRAAFMDVLADAALPGRSWRELLGRAIQTFARVHREDPPIRALFANMQLYGEFAEADLQMTREFARATAEIIRAWAPSLDAAQREVIAIMVVQTIAGILVLVPREPPASAQALLEQLELMLCRYLQPWIEPT